MAGRMLELALAIKGKIDDTFPASLRKAAGSMDELAKKSAKLQSVSKNADAFQKTSHTVATLQDKLGFVQENLQRATAALYQTSGATKQAQKTFQQTANEVREVSAALSDEKAKLEGITQELEKAGFATDDFANNQQRLQKHIEMVNKTRNAQNNLETARASRDAAGQRLSNANINFQAGIDMAKTVTEPLIEATKEAMEFESAMADVRKVVDFDTPQQFKKMSDDVLALSQKLPMTANDIAKIVAAGGQSGIAREDLMSFAESAVKMGIAFDVTADQAGDMMAKWRTAFKMGQPEVVALADKINYLGNTTAASAPLISDVVTRIGPLGEIGGVASGEIAALGASMVGTGVQSDVAATGIKNLILGLVAGEGATKSQAAAFSKLGMNATDVAKRMQVDAKGAILDVMKALQSLSKDEQASTLADLFGKESIGAISPLLSNLSALQDNFNKVADASKYAGSMEAEYAARSATTENKVQLAKNAMKALKISIGTVLLPAVGAVADKIAPILQGFAQWVRQNQTLVATLAGVATAVMGVVFAFLGLSVVTALVEFMIKEMLALKAGIAVARNEIMLTAVATKISAIATAIHTAATAAFGRAMLFLKNPILTSLGALQLFKNGLSTVGDAADKLPKKIGKAFSNLNFSQMIKGGASALWGVIGSIASAFSTVIAMGLPVILIFMAIVAVIALVVANFDKIKETATIVFNHISGTASAWVAKIQAAFQTALNTITGIWNSITGQSLSSSQLISEIINNIGFAIGVAFDIAAGVVGTAVMVIINLIAAMAQIIGGIIKIVVSILNGDWEGAWEGAKTAVNGFADGTIGTFKTVANGIGDMFDTIMGKSDEMQKKAEEAKAAATPAVGVDDADGFAVANAQQMASSTQQAANSAQALSSNMQQAGANAQTASGNTQTLQNILSQLPGVSQTAFAGMGTDSALAAQAVTTNLQQIPTQTQAVFDQIPQQAQTAMQQVPTQMQGSFDQMGPMAQTSVDAIAAEYAKLAEKCQPGGDAFVQAANQWGQNAYTAIANWSGQMASVVVEKLSSAWSQISSQFSAGLNVNVTTTNTVVTKTVSEGAEAHNALGGIYPKGEFTTTFAEKSPEAAIPLDGSNRAIALWQRAGQMLGMLPKQQLVRTTQEVTKAEAQAPVVMAPPVSNREVNLEFKPTITIQGNASADTAEMIRQALREQAQQFKDALPGMLNRIKANERRLSYE